VHAVVKLMMGKKKQRVGGHPGKTVNRLKYSVLIIWRLRMTYEYLVLWDSSKIEANFVLAFPAQ